MNRTENMILSYPGKKTEADIIQDTSPAKIHLKKSVGPENQSPNMIIEGDNLTVLKTLLEEFNLQGKVDLVYIDPPFSTNNTFKSGETRTSTISPGHSDPVAYFDNLTGYHFLEFLRERLVLLREILADHGSIYVHIDAKAGHYLKVTMDEIFGGKNFRNDITRIKCNPKNFKRRGFGNIKDMVLFYSKTDDFTWNEPKESMTDDDVETLFPKTDKNGRHYTTIPLHAPGETKNGETGKPWRGMLPPKGRHWRCAPSLFEELDKEGLIEWSSTGNPRRIIFADEKKKEGKRLQDIWNFKDSPYPTYPTEKNLDLLKTIIGASSNPGDMVLDCFCGSGTTLLAAQQLGRRWIGIDQSSVAVSAFFKKLKKAAPQGSLFQSSHGYQYFKAD